MTRTTKLGAFCMVGSFALATAAWAQDTPAQSQQATTTQQTTQVTDDGATRTTKTTTVEGKVVRTLVPVSVRSESERGTYNNKVQGNFIPGYCPRVIHSSR